MSGYQRGNHLNSQNNPNFSNSQSKDRLSLNSSSNNSSLNRQSLLPAKLGKGNLLIGGGANTNTNINNNSNNNLGYSNVFSDLPNSFGNLQSDAQRPNVGRTSLGSNRLSLAPRQSLLPNSGTTLATGRQSLANRQSVGGGAEGQRHSTSGFKSSISASGSLGIINQLGNGLGGNAVIAMKEPRNIRDKGFIMEKIKLLVHYLVNSGYDKPISIQVLAAPSAKDFQYIFRFLYLRIDPEYQFNGKFEDQVLSLIRVIRYPLANDINKSQLAAVGSMHTWPVLLGLLAWMVELNIILENLRVEFSTENAEYRFFEFLLSGYQSYIDGEDIEIKRTELISNFQLLNVPICKEIEKLRKNVAETQAAIDELENGDRAIPKLQREKKEFASDIDRFKKFLKMLESKRDKLIESVEKQKEIEALTANEIRELEEEKKNLQHQVDTQQICPEDIERINSEKEMLLKTIDSLNQQKDEANKAFWEREMFFQKKFDSIERIVQEFNHYGEKLGIIPVDAPYSKGINFQLGLNPQAGKPDLIVNPNLREHIQPSLFQLRDYMNDIVHTSQTSLIGLQEQLETLNDTITEKQEEIVNVDERIKKYNQQYIDEKEALNLDSKKRTEEIEGLQNELLKIKTETSNSYISSQQYVQKANLDFDNLQIKIKEESESISAEICNVLEELLSFKTHIESSLNDLTNVADSCFNSETSI